MYEPIRGGTRGGKDQFKWESLRTMSQNEREQYLGFTTQVGFLDKGGKWRKRDWYAKTDNKRSNDELLQELQRVRDEDERRQREALGLAPKQEQKLTKQEMAQLLDKIKNPGAELSAVEKQEKEEEELKDKMHGIGYSLNAKQLQQKAQKSAQNGSIGNMELNPYKLEGTSSSYANDYELPVIINKSIKKPEDVKSKARKNSEDGDKKHKKEKKDKKDKKKKSKKDKKKHKKSKKHKRIDTDSESD